VVKSAFLLSFGYLPLWKEVLAGTFAGFVQVIVTSPIESLKVVLQTGDMTMDHLMERIYGYMGLFPWNGSLHSARRFVYSHFVKTRILSQDNSDAQNDEVKEPSDA
jgi:hypothetical protein